MSSVTRLAIAWAIALILVAPVSAQAAATWSVVPFLPDGPASTVGSTIVFDITLTTTGPELLGISGSANAYDSNVVAPATIGHTIASELLHQVCFPSAGCFNGVANFESGLRVESGVEGPGNEATFVSILSVTPATGDGSLDGGAQFSIVFDIFGGGATQIRFGTYADYGDAYAGGDGVVNNVEFTIVVADGQVIITPEPGTALLLGLGLLGLTRENVASRISHTASDDRAL